MEADTLNILVSGAIWRAEQMEDAGVASAPQAWMEVSAIEEKLGGVFPSSVPEGKIARRGAVRAALKAGDYARARDLVERYSAEPRVPKALKTGLREMLDEDDRLVASHYPYAARQYRVAEARTLALRFQRAGAFGLAA
jgi:hypothetical protein